MTWRIVFRALLAVLGLLLAAALRGTRWLIGVHPIGHLVQLAETAPASPRVADVVR